MGEYIVKSGQNILDVSLDIYGSIEGIGDLLVNNESLSLDDKLNMGDILFYSDDFLISPDVTAYNKVHSILPANGERNIYYKCSDLPLCCELYLKNSIHYFEFVMGGNGVIEIDWNDNTSLERIVVGEAKSISHSFDSVIIENRKIRIYGNPYINSFNLNCASIEKILVFEPVGIERLSLVNQGINLDFLRLVTDIFNLNLSGCSINSLLPLLSLHHLMLLDLSHIKTLRDNVDDYLIGLVENYGNRRCCEVILTTEPKGEFKEPIRNENGNYMINTGMEAIWVIVNEESWNEGGYWKFNVNGEIYTKG